MTCPRAPWRDAGESYVVGNNWGQTAMSTRLVDSGVTASSSVAWDTVVSPRLFAASRFHPFEKGRQNCLPNNGKFRGAECGTGIPACPLRDRPSEKGVSLLEMLVVVTLIAIMISISYPAISSGLETIRLNSAAESVVAFLDGALTRADRKQMMTEVVLLPRESKLLVRSAEPGFVRELELPDGVTIARIAPEVQGLDPANPRTFFVYPGGSAPRIGVELVNRRGSRRFVRVDPITGVPVIEKGEISQP